MINSVIGIVTARDPTTYRIKASLPEYDGMISPWCSVLTAKAAQDKHVALPDIGEQVVIILELDLNRGFVIGSLFSNADTVPTTDGDTTMTKFSDNTQVSYNRKTHELTVNCVGNITLNATGNISINAGGTVSINAPKVDINK